MNKISFTQFGKQMWGDQEAVTSLEYALLGTLIAVAIVVGVGLLGTNTAAMFTLASNCVEFAISGNGICS